MSDRWMIRGREYGNCDWGCPCQFSAPSTYGKCEAIVSGIIEEGYFNDTRLDGLNWVILVKWPGEIIAGNGTQQVIIDERADDDQREALRKILHGESTAPGSTHFFVYNSTMSEVLETQSKPIELSIDVEARTERIKVPDMIESTGTPITSPLDGSISRSRIHLPNGFEYTYAEMCTGTTSVKGSIELEFSESYGQFNLLHMNQDGVIR